MRDSSRSEPLLDCETNAQSKSGIKQLTQARSSSVAPATPAKSTTAALAVMVCYFCSNCLDRAAVSQGAKRFAASSSAF
jgi:hypothetical protein